jgi:hypothetical protein
VALLSLDADLGSAGGVDGIADPMKNEKTLARGDDSQYGAHLSTAMDERGKSKTVREMVREIQVELRDREVVPSRARELLIELTALSGNCSTEMRQADADYNAVLLRHLDGEEAANRATIRAKATQEYARAREATDTYKLVLEMIRSLKKVLSSIEQEMRMAH